MQNLFCKTYKRQQKGQKDEQERKMSDADRNVNGNKQADENNNLERKSDADKNMDENKENDKKQQYAIYA